LTSDRQRHANRVNARASTGPKTKAGVARASLNALRHGLNVSVWKDPALSPQAEAIARAIAGPDAGTETLTLARAIGEAQVALQRVRARRLSLLQELPPSSPASAEKWQPLVEAIERIRSSCPQSFAALVSVEGDENLTKIMIERSAELGRLDRYERRALSSRKTSIRRFDERMVHAGNN
jgi:hypothetical protein